MTENEFNEAKQVAYKSGDKVIVENEFPGIVKEVGTGILAGSYSVSLGRSGTRVVWAAEMAYRVS